MTEIEQLASRHAKLFTTRLICCLVLWFCALSGAALPILLNRRHHGALTARAWMSFVCGVLLGGSLLHLLPEAHAQLEPKFGQFPLAFVLGGVGVLVGLFSRGTTQHDTFLPTTPSAPSRFVVGGLFRNHLRAQRFKLQQGHFGRVSAFEDEDDTPLQSTQPDQAPNPNQDVGFHSDHDTNNTNHHHLHHDNASTQVFGDSPTLNAQPPPPQHPRTLKAPRLRLPFALHNGGCCNEMAVFHLALFAQAVVEGISVGSQRSTRSTVGVCVAAAVQLAVSCVSLSFALQRRRWAMRNAIASLSVLSLAGPLGVWFGIGLIRRPNRRFLAACVSAVAGGVFLFVALTAVSPVKAQQVSPRQLVFSLVGIVAGFGLMAVVAVTDRFWD